MEQQIVNHGIFYHILYMEHADNIVNAFVIHHDTGIFFFRYDVRDILQRRVQRDCNNIRSVGRNFAHRNITQIENVVNHFLFRFVNAAHIAARINHLADAFLSDVVFLLRLLLFHQQGNQEQIDQQRYD